MGGAADDAAEVVRDALEGTKGAVEVTLALPRRTAEKILVLLEAESLSGAVVVPVKDLYSTTEAASMLGISRPTLMKLIEAGDLEPEMVGTHHRIPAEAILAYQRAQQASRDRAAEVMSEFAGRATRGYQQNVSFRAPGEAAR